MAELTRPPLRYYGGKWRLGPWILGHFPLHRTYIEPFGGGAGVLLQKSRAILEVYNDLDQEVVRFFRVLRECPEALARAVACTPYAVGELEAARAPSDDPVEAARRFLVRSWMSRGGPTIAGSGFRRNVTPVEGAGPPAACNWVDVPEVLLATAQRLRGVQIEQGPASEVIARYDTPETLHYVDPPYLAETRCRQHAEAGYVYELDEAGHRALAAQLHAVRGMVVLSGYPSPLYEALYAGWRRVERTAQTQGTKRGTEVLWLSPATQRWLERNLQAHLFHFGGVG